VKSIIIFDGPGPFSLPTAQRATATGHGNKGVTITFKMLLSMPENGVFVQRRPEPEAVSVQMVTAVAQDLAAALMRATTQSQGGRRWTPKDNEDGPEGEPKSPS
jgi:hypothetical protein